MSDRVDPPSSSVSVTRAATDSELPDDEGLESRLRSALAPNLLLVRLIGSGGMARVFLAREPALKRLVAVKVLSAGLAADADARKRFEREAQAVAALSHPNIVAIHGVGELSDGTPYFVMQHVAGRSMGARVDEEGPLPLADGRRALAEVAAALATAHQQGIIHRDIKPANILYEDATGRSLVSDFGIAAIAPTADGSAAKLTGTGIWLGTPQYMSPEQLINEPVSEKTDIYSVGLLAHELLAGSGPFQGTTPNQLIAAHLRDVPPLLSQRRPEVDAELDSLIARCLDKKAERRPSALEVSKRLSAGGTALLEWPPPGLEELHGTLRRLSTLFWIGGALMLLSLLTLTLNGPRIEAAFTSPGTLLLALAGAAAVAQLLFAARRAVQLGRLTSEALRDGYAWTTVLEVASDHKADSGSMIAGAREYAAIGPEGRSAFRRRRIRRELISLASALSIVPMLLIIVVAGSTGLAPARALWLAAIVPLLGALAAMRIEGAERAAFAAGRKKKMSGVPRDRAKLAGSWYASFDAARGDQTLGRGTPDAPQAGRVAAVAASILVVVGALLLSPLLLVAAFGPAFWAITVPKFSNTRQKLQVASVAREYMLPRDPAITSLEAGRAYYALTSKRGRSQVSKFAELPVPQPALPPRPWEGALDSSLFRTARPDMTVGIPSVLKIMEAAHKGLSGPEKAYLKTLANAPHWRAFDTMARAPRTDNTGARYKLPFADSAGGAWNFPIPSFSSVKDMAYAGVARAAYHLSEGRRDSAEVAVRGVISAGFVMIDNSSTLIEELVGAVVVGIGRHGLVQYYAVIGDPRGARLQARTDSVIALIDSRADVRAASTLLAAGDVGDPSAVRSALRRIAEDPREQRGLRSEMLLLLASSPCTNLRELIFGAGPDVRATYEVLQRTWARFPSDSAMLDLMYRTPELLASLAPETTRAQWLMRVARMEGAILRNPRIPGCAAMAMATQ